MACPLRVLLVAVSAVLALSVLYWSAEDERRATGKEPEREVRTCEVATRQAVASVAPRSSLAPL